MSKKVKPRTPAIQETPVTNSSASEELVSTPAVTNGSDVTESNISNQPPVEPVVGDETPVVEEVVLSILDRTLAKHKVETPTVLIAEINRRMNEYVTNMAANKPISADVGGMHQVNLFYTIITALEQKDVSSSLLALDLILAYIAENNTDCFSERLAYRYYGNIPLDTGRRKSFEVLMYLLLNIADAKTRRSFLMRADITRVLDTLPSEICKRNLLTFVSL